MDFIHFGGETIVGFIGERGGDNSFHAGVASRISQKPRINSVAGNDPENVWNFHEARLTMDWRSTQARLRLTPPATLHVELSERLLQRGLHRRDFFRPEVFLHRLLRSFHRSLRRLLVDHRRLQRHIRQN